MAASVDLSHAVLETWRTNSRLMSYLIERLPDQVWPMPVPGAPRRTVRSIAVHVHNCRCMWTRNLGRRHGVRVPAQVDGRRASRRALLEALPRSGRGVARIIKLGLERGGKLPGFPLDIVHFMTYLSTHEAHHRGQICTIARQHGHRLPNAVLAGLWQWSNRAKEAE